MRDMNEKDMLADKYVVDESRLMKKRSIQQKLVEFVMLYLISKETIFQLIDTLFLDMAGDYETFDELREIERKFLEEPERVTHKSSYINDEAQEEMDGGKRDDSEEDEDFDDFSSQELKSIAPSSSDSHSYESDEESDEAGSDGSFKLSHCGVDHDRMFGHNSSEYIEIKSLLTVERIKDIIGELVSACPKVMNFEILQYFMRGVIFENKKLRDSFM